MIEIQDYSESFRDDWNRFLADCKNSHFMFHRDYMEYHADKYTEYSQILFKNNKMVGILPANLSGDEVVSHGWLTFGGILCDNKMTASLMLDFFDILIEKFRKQGIRSLTYKAIPHIYHKMPSEEDLYALFRVGATLYRRDVSSTVELSKKPRLSKGKKWSIKKALNVEGFKIQGTDNIEQFWVILTSLLKGKYDSQPAHSVDDMKLLKKRFPDNIKLFGAYVYDELIGGTLIFDNLGTAHTQYIASTDYCREVGGLDALFSHLITKQFVGHRYFNFGISNEQDGRILNEGLAAFKEGFGARTIVHDFYRLDLTR